MLSVFSAAVVPWPPAIRVIRVSRVIRVIRVIGARVTQVEERERGRSSSCWGRRFVGLPGSEGRGMHGREEIGLLDRTGWGAILGRKHLPTAFGSFEGKRPKRGREPKRSNDGVPFLPGEPLCLAPVWTERATNPSGLQRGTDAHK